MRPSFLLLILCLLFSFSSFAWGKKGHSIVAQIAFHYLSKEDSAKIMSYLGGMSIEEAANWMDRVKNDPKFSYTNSWHYINFPKGGLYVPTDKPDIVNALNATIDDVKTNGDIKKEQVSLDLLILIHLTGDIHQPLHTGYTEDKGGLDYEVSFQGKTSNLYQVWDSEMIDAKNISFEDCLAVANEMKGVQIGNVIDWLNDSRSLVESCYPATHAIDQAYINAKTPVIKERLALAGIRLAALFHDIVFHLA